MDIPKLVKENEDLKSQVKMISEKFNAYIMRDKETGQIMNTWKISLQHWTSPNKGIPGFASGDGVLSTWTWEVQGEKSIPRNGKQLFNHIRQQSLQTLNYLRKQLLKKDRQVHAQKVSSLGTWQWNQTRLKKAVTFLRGQSSSSTPNTSTSGDAFDWPFAM